ncbi:substrate-binding domain-containing protein [Bacillus sp. MRMR6]|uniref:substrate-binding domain-containing protein n=1 Tax=Bacillus sp. MRMR6 TaxID=1928617 RepID=UPI000AFA7272|nr:substrate-binding domain-containing protein [Bacillus sp. MRMR6]
MMKNLLKGKTLLFLLMSLMLLLAACGPTGTGGQTDDAKSGSGGSKDSEKLVIGFSQVGAESEWRTANTKSMQEAIKAAGHELKFSDAQQKQENQIKAIRSFIAQKVDAIVFSPVVETGFETVLQEAKDAGIP